MSDRALQVGSRWLLLIHQLPAKPAYLRVKIWRRLHGIGAVAVKNSVYALPVNEQSQEDFEWLRREIAEAGGDAIVCEARLVEGLSDEDVRGLFDAARDADYDAIATDARAVSATLKKPPSPERRAEAKAQLARLRNRLAQVVAIDFFGANGRDAAEGLVAGIEAKLAADEPPGPTPAAAAQNPQLAALKGKTWVTRRGVHVDRVASAWLIRRFIDPDARLKFVPPRGYKPEPGELRFDMFEAEYTHEGDRCTFEVLLARAYLRDPALTAIAEIVHDIDLKDGKFGREETAGIATLITGLAIETADDDVRIARGSEIFDSLYAYFRKKPG
jgi:hypothetical protein